MLEIKLVDGTIIKVEKEYIWMDDIYKDLNNISEFVKTRDKFQCKNKWAQLCAANKRNVLIC